jgi:hypothetical protein
MSLCQMAKKLSWLRKKSENDPLVYYRPTPPQKAYLADPSPIKALIGGNQVGKTVASCALLLYHCLDRHPYLRTDPPPIEAWMITHSHEQSRTIQQKLYDMIPKDELHPSCEFVRGKGFRGLAPLVKFRNGSIIRIKTANQGLGLASASCSLVVVDEPVDIATYNEIIARISRGGAGGKRGTLALSLTPVGGVDVSYLRELIDKKLISAHRAPLTVESTTPIGLPPGYLLSQEQIDRIVEGYLPYDRAARVMGSFDVAPQGVIFENFEDDMISSQPVPKGGDYRFCIGIDHGSTPGSQVAILSCIDMKDPQNPRVYVLGEYVSGQAPPEHHAQAILDMLKKYGVDPKVCKWTGDGEHRGRGQYRMSNILLMRAFESILGYPPRNLPFTVRQAIKKRHSVYFGASLLHAIMSRRHFWIRPECTETIKAIRSWTIGRSQSVNSRNVHGHKIDALRYGLLPILDYRITVPKNIRVF